MAIDLDKKILRQIEYYFGDINLPRDKFMQEKIKEDEGWVGLDVLLTFKRLASLTTDAEKIANVIKESESKLIEVSEDLKKLRRNPEVPLPELNEERRKELMTRTAYAKGFPLDEILDNINEFMKDQGDVESVQMRTYKDPKTSEHKFKGSCFIIFKDIDECKKFVESEGIKYKEKDLLRKMQQDYIEEKRKETEERKNRKSKKKDQNNQDEDKNDNKKFQKTLEFPKGAVVHFKGIKEGETLTREEIKDKIKELTEMEAKFLEFSKGDVEGHIRMKNENDGVIVCEKLEGKLDIGEIKLELRVLQGEEEEEYLKKTVASVLDIRQKQKGRKRKGHFGGDGPKYKRK
ncbi:la protein homolog [Onthophagus taurus]|uniref:la protein homolog n=1 Tax=Onthophagus taurus TaxID=166361 RepID=UPI0039BE2016